MPIARSTWFTTPRSGFRSETQSTATATPLRTDGRKRIVRNRYIPLTRRLRRSASASPATRKRGTARTV